MKYTTLIIIPVLFAFGCGDDVKELTTKTLPYSIDQTTNVDLGQSDPKTFSATQEFDATAEVSKFNSKLDAIEVKGITMEFFGYSGDNVLITDASFEFVGTGSSISIADDIDLNLVSGKGAITLDVSGINFTDINAKFLADKKLTVLVSTAVDKVPVVFTVKVTLDFEVTGSLL
jgi:hypothetical protein